MLAKEMKTFETKKVFSFYLTQKYVTKHKNTLKIWG